MPENKPFAVATEVPPSDPPALSEDGGTSPPDTPIKHRSGFSRQKAKVVALESRVQELEESHENLLTDYEGLLSDHDRLERDFAKLESAYGEVCQLNSELAAQVQRLKSQRPAPVRYGAPSLMGGM
jgi:hypothetical protein